MDARVRRITCRTGETRDAILVMHHGHPVLVEPEPITLAKMPITGDNLSGSVLFHPRYLSKGVKADIIKIHGLRLGRGIDILADEPYSYEEETYGIISFKGVGATPPGPRKKDMLVENGRFNSRVNGRGEERIWGAHKRKSAIDELGNHILKDHGIPEIPHLRVNAVPEIVVKKMLGPESTDELGQLVRLATTNIRFEYLSEFSDQEVDELIDLEKIASIDSILIRKQLDLMQSDSGIVICGTFTQNRFVDGRITDRENFELLYQLKKYRILEIISKIVNESIDAIRLRELDSSKEKKYFSILEKNTGLDCSSFLEFMIWHERQQGKMGDDEFHEILQEILGN